MATMTVLTFAPHPGVAQAPAQIQLRPGDALRILVKDEPTWSGDFPIAEDGTVLLPAVGAIHVTDRPFADVRSSLLAAYETQLVNPEVQITPLVRIAVLGEVQRPGLFTVDPTQALADVLASAGGIGPQGDRGKIQLVRDGRILHARLDPRSQGLGLHLQSGDQVFVGRRSWLSQNSQLLFGVLGSVTTAVIASLIVR
jgi:polysaccharide export outer membrane protein